MDFTLSEAAEKFIRRLLRMSGKPESGFRLVMTAEGCSGLAGDFAIESGPRPGDAVHEIKGIRFFLPAESRLLLAGVAVDFADSPLQTGLVFHDPKKASCGCATGPEAKAQVASIPIASIGKRS